jgi:hypothetical protein
MARVLIVGGGCRGRRLAGALMQAGHAVRVTTRDEAGRAAIEATGAECWVGDPDRIATLRLALDRVTVACWLLGTASGDAEHLQALFGTRLEYWLTQVIDTTVRGFLYEASGTAPPGLLASGAGLVERLCALNAIPFAMLDAPVDGEGWQTGAMAAIDGFLAPSS